MKKFIIVLFLFLTAVFCFAQVFDDLPFPSPDATTWIQQEMSSLIRFQFENDINVPFFATFSGRNNTLFYKSEYAEYVNSFGDELIFDRVVAADVEVGILLGGQIKVNSSFYIPIFFSASIVEYQTMIDGEWLVNDYGKGYQVNINPYMLIRSGGGAFLGSGLNINTDKLKGGIYLGYGNFFNTDLSEKSYSDEDDNAGIKIAIVPLVDTSSMAYIGKALSSVMGYLGMGDAVMGAEKETGGSEINAFMKTINAGLDLTFNKFDFGPLSLKANAIYLRGNYNLVAKADTYGLKLQGRLSNFPFGFSVEGGLKHFFSVSPYLGPYYPDTGYVNASIFFPLKYFTIGTIYQYDIIYESKFIFAVSTNFLSGYYAYNPRTNYNKDQFDGAETTLNFGARFRWGGWNAKGK
jgi:hypothetical protein